MNQISIFLGQVAVTITISLLASWLVAVSLIPMISARIKAPPSLGKTTGFVPWLTDRYARGLRWSLEHRAKSVAGIALVVAVSLVPVAAGWMKVDMFKNDAGREIDIYFDWRGAYSMDEMLGEMLKVEEVLERNREAFQIEQIYTVFSERGWGGVDVTLRSEGGGLIPTEELQEKIRKVLPKSALAEIGIEGSGGQGGGGGGGRNQGVRVSLNGDSNEELQVLAEDILPVLARRPELRDVRIDTGDEASEVQVSVDRARAAAYGFSAQDVAQYIGIALRGTPLREFRRAGEEVPVWVRFAGAEQFSIDQLSSLS